MGKWVIEHLLDSHKGTIYCYDTNPRSSAPVSSKVILCRISEDADYTSYREQFKPNDWVFVVVPMSSFEQTIRGVAPYLEGSSLVVTLSSIQAEPIRILSSAIPSHSTYCGFHPLFGANIGSPIGQIAAITAFDEARTQHLAFCRFLKDRGMLTTFLSAEEHDNYMAYIQALTHFCLMGFAASLTRNDVHPKALLELRTPNFRFLYAFASRVIKLSPTTTGAIQSTKDASRVRKAFLETLISLHDKFEMESSPESCARVIRALCDPLTGAEVDEGAEVAAVAVSSLQSFEELLHHYKETGAAFVFRHRIANRIKIVKIIDIAQDDIEFEESYKAKTDNGVKRFAIGLDPIAKENYRAMGISFPAPSKDRIKKRNIKLLTGRELSQFRNESILPITIDLNLLNPFQLVEEDFEEWLPIVVDGLFKCDFVDTYRKRGQVERVTVKLAFSPLKKRDEIVESIRRVVEKRQLLKATTKEV